MLGAMLPVRSTIPRTILRSTRAFARRSHLTRLHSVARPFISQLVPSYIAGTRLFSAGASNTGSLDERTYHRVADEALDHLVEYLENLGDELDIDGYDVVYSQGVLTLRVGDETTYVINKQPPNKQIWLSSPLSGPKRFDYSSEAGKWVYSRESESLQDLLSRELSSLLKRDIDIGSVL
ncbi:Mitochondrial chaperone Frataxin [Rhizophlyctis rosea]|uniref:ferroxidase n=1 Tax=Rhizophlyctis rosea TaxID=64517 RepID=A0AAD5SB43_9FUNG|nr:Mitochondrial chaperone Frataxin [Rhizophlyctis rosea]